MGSEECRAAPRIDVDAPCVYVMQEGVDPERFTLQQGVGRVVNVSRGGMLVLLDLQPPVRQIFQVHVFLPHAADRVLALVEVRWTWPAENQEKSLVGCEFLFGPYSAGQERICHPKDFLPP